jgi:hypothetical protein
MSLEDWFYYVQLTAGNNNIILLALQLLPLKELA